jgi:hypothetical protein
MGKWRQSDRRLSGAIEGAFRIEVDQTKTAKEKMQSFKESVIALRDRLLAQGLGVGRS